VRIVYSRVNTSLKLVSKYKKAGSIQNFCRVADTQTANSRPHAADPPPSRRKCTCECGVRAGNLPDSYSKACDQTAYITLEQQLD